MVYVYLVAAVWLVTGICGAFSVFAAFRSIKLESPPFSKEEISEWDRKWLPGDLFMSVIAAVLGPIAILLGFFMLRER